MPPRFEGKFGIPSSHAIESELTKSLYRLPESITSEEVETFTKEIAHRVDVARTLDSSSEPLTESEIHTLQLKLARHFEGGANIASLNVPTCVDALVESPKFLNSDKGSIAKLFEIHEMKTLQKIAELHRKRSEQTESDGLNPYENLFETSSGNYYLAKLLNMPHLVEESDYMTHCVGTSTSYINKIKRGEVEIFSLRTKATHEPMVTIEYNPKSGQLLQVKMEHDDVPTFEDDFFADLLESIEMLKGTIGDENKMRLVDTEAVQYYKKIDGILHRLAAGVALDRNDLLFIYEVDSITVGFEGEKDPRLAELRQQRDRQKDIKILCDCPPEYIVTDVNNITEATLVLCSDTDSKLSFVDFREEKNTQKLSQIIEFTRAFRETGSPARLDVAIEGGIVQLEIDQNTFNSLKTCDSAIEAFKAADSVPAYIHGPLNEIQWTTIQSNTLAVHILKHESFTLKDCEQMVVDMDKSGYRPLNFSELVALGIIRPDLNNYREILRLCEIYSLKGSSDKSSVVMPYLAGRAGERHLTVSLAKFVTGEENRFLFVSK